MKFVLFDFDNHREKLMFYWLGNFVAGLFAFNHNFSNDYK